LIILDTSFLFALKAEKDTHFSRANEILDLLLDKYKEILLTPYLVVNETITLSVARYKGNMGFIKKYFELFWGNECFFELIKLEPKEYKKISQILKQYVSNKKRLSYTDASLIYLYKKYNATYLVSFDTHFDTILNRLY
jgi:predicted nucleic acid-binding protein